MFAGHVGVALAIGRAERRVNVGAFIGAALLLDVLLWLFVLLGWESLVIPADFARTHQPDFVFPYSHGLLAGLGWSAVAGALGAATFARLGPDRWRAGALLAVAVFSHWLLDLLVHQPEMPLTGAGSPRLGLALWRDMPLALLVEGIFAVAGLALFVPGSALARGRAWALSALVLLILAFTVAGMTLAPAPPSALAMAGSSLVTIVLVVALACWLGAARAPGH